MADGMPIGMRIKRRRQALGMKQEDLAAAVGVSRAAVSNWESGRHFPERHQGAVEHVLGIRLDEPENDPVPPRLRVMVPLIRQTLSPARAAHLEAAIEAAYRAELASPGESSRREEKAG